MWSQLQTNLLSFRYTPLSPFTMADTYDPAYCIISSKTSSKRRLHTPSASSLAAGLFTLATSLSVTRSYYRGAAGALLVYDVSSRESFSNLNTWLADLRQLASQDLVAILVGNKVDKEEDREVAVLEASKFAQENEMMFMEASALTGEGVEDIFLKCARSILTKIETGQIDPEKIGSGIQFGDSSLRLMRKGRGGAKLRRKTSTSRFSNCC
ncbi:P-loop containing nucleoside triphosphate hydrolase protein [Endogone sp. FLAS-F59071]|nr:P-loop containing nucleoside triphosphate hydrolase protein [Endogone sp. FLAS-F59071]|eukprot:RUS15221.1 P-loop containing nucleoside triphosphate hydrolase protein [Endogone sp. FLAS-F59071]